MNERFEIQYAGEWFGWWRTLIIESDLNRAVDMATRFRNSTSNSGHKYRLVHILDEFEK